MQQMSNRTGYIRTSIGSGFPARKGASEKKRKEEKKKKREKRERRKGKGEKKGKIMGGILEKFSQWSRQNANS